MIFRCSTNPTCKTGWPPCKTPPHEKIHPCAPHFVDCPGVLDSGPVEFAGKAAGLAGGAGSSGRIAQPPRRRSIGPRRGEEGAGGAKQGARPEYHRRGPGPTSSGQTRSRQSVGQSAVVAAGLESSITLHLGAQGFSAAIQPAFV